MMMVVLSEGANSRPTWVALFISAASHTYADYCTSPPDRLPTRHHPPTPQLILVSRWSMHGLPMRMEKFETFSHQQLREVFKPSAHETSNEPKDTLSIHQLVFWLVWSCISWLAPNFAQSYIISDTCVILDGQDVCRQLVSRLPHRIASYVSTSLTTTFAPHFFSLLTTSLLFFSRPPPCSCLLIHRAAARRRFLFKSCFCLRVEINWAPKTNPAITFK